MLDTSTLFIFMAASMALLVTPGPAVLYIVARSIDQGRMAGLASIGGIIVGTYVHIAAAALGLSALLLSSAVAFNVVKYLGAAYLVYLGLRTLLTPPKSSSVGTPERESLRHIFNQGIVVNVLNPKAALFFFAFLPQFIDPNRGNVIAQIFLLGTVFVVLAFFSDGTYALLAGTLGNWLRNNPGFLRAQRYFAGTVYILLGITTALSGSRSK